MTDDEFDTWRDAQVAAKQAKIDRVKKILAENGIRMEVTGCGCCGSPMVKFEFDGELLVDDENFDFTMFQYGE